MLDVLISNNFGINTIELQIDQSGKEAFMVIKTISHGSVDKAG